LQIPKYQKKQRVIKLMMNNQSFITEQIDKDVIEDEQSFITELIENNEIDDEHLDQYNLNLIYNR
jgi:hypothetical protein